MKAINLIPADQRRGAGGAAGRTGGAAYGLIGLLAIALLVFGSWTLTKKQVNEKTAEAASLEAQAQIRSRQASALGSYTKFAEIRGNRVQTVKQLADSRFDWAHSFGEVSRTLPDNVWLTALTGTIAPGVGSDVGGASDPLRTARAVPALELNGCAVTQEAVTRLIGRLELMNGVDRVAISSSKRSDSGGESDPTSGVGDSAAGSTTKYVRDNPCTPKRPTFSLVVFYKGLINPPGKSGKPELNESAGTGQPGAAGGTATTTTPGATTTTPGATTTTTPAPSTGTQSAPATTTGGTQ